MLPKHVMSTISDRFDRQRENARPVAHERPLRSAHRDRLETIGHLAGGIAHDVNNLLTAILLNADLLAERITDERLRSLAETARMSAERAGDLTRGLLAYARSQPTGPPRPVNVNVVVAQVGLLLSRMLGELIAVRIVTGDGVGMVRVDVSELESAILNLAINARDAMPRGGNLTITTGRSSGEADRDAPRGDQAAGDFVVISIADDGVGMAEGIATRAVDPFFGTKGDGGNGLGLTVVEDFARGSGGHIRIDSTVGTGTTVHIYLPAVAGASDEAENLLVPDAAMRGSESILVVEDDRVLLAHVEAMLTDLGYRVTGVSAATQALDVLSMDSPLDLLFTDMVIPGGMTGSELAAHLRARWPDLAVLYTSGYCHRPTPDGVGAANDSMFLAKPYRRRDLAAAVRALLDRPRDRRPA